MAISILTSVIVNLLITHFHRHPVIGRQDSSGTQVNMASKTGGNVLQKSPEIFGTPQNDIILNWNNLILPYGPPHDKTNKMTVHPAKTQISLGIRPV